MTTESNDNLALRSTVHGVPAVDVRRELRRTWAMGPSRGVDGGVVAHPLHTGVPGPVLRTYVTADGAHHLLVPGRYRGPSVVGDSLRAEPRRLSFGNSTDDFLDIACIRRPLFDVFDDLVLLIVEATSSSERPVDAAAAVIARWRELLRSRTAAGLTPQRELGLFAELVVLDHLSQAGRLEAEWWRGPLAEPKDILIPGAWIEVKGVGETTDRVRIHGLEQLEDEEGQDGYLALVVVAPSEDGETAGEIAARVKARSEAKERFDERLALAGLATADPRGRRFEVMDLYLVEAIHCPRLVSTSLAGPVDAGISDIQYLLDIDVVRALARLDPVETLRAMGSER
jgi:hypothetical protein